MCLRMCSKSDGGVILGVSGYVGECASGYVSRVCCDIATLVSVHILVSY